MSTFRPSDQNYEGDYRVSLFDSASNDAYIEIVYGGTIGGTPNWQSAGNNSTVEYDVAGTTVTGGEVIHAGFVTAGQGASRNSINQILNNRFPLVLDHAGLNPINI